MEQQYLTIWDLVLTPLYLIILTAIARRIRDKNYPVGNPLRRYYLPGLMVKLGGAIFIALVYQFYYGGQGDTFNFYTHSQIINSALDKSFITWLKLLVRVSPEVDPSVYPFSSQLYWYDAPADYAVPAIGAIFGLLNGTTYVPIALLFAFFSYTGIWAMYRTFVNIYPTLHKPLAFAFLFVPSTFVWGSAMFKDTACMFALGWMTYTTFRMFINKDFSLRNILLFALSFYLIATIKVYILLAFAPALALWLLMTYSRRIRYASLRWALNFVFVGICALGFYIFSQVFAQELGRYSLEKITQTAQTTQNWIGYVSELEGGSAYDIGKFEPTLTGMLSKFPQAVTVTLFRPFLWEIKKPIMLLSAAESFVFIILLFAIFFRQGIKNVFKKIIADPNLLFFLLYSLIFAFAVGISTGNFGTLSRYKIPCMPFFAALLVILYFQQENRLANSQKHAKTKRTVYPVS